MAKPRKDAFVKAKNPPVVDKAKVKKVAKKKAKK